MDVSTASAPVPDASRPPRFTGRLVVGLAVIAVGLLFLLDAFGLPGIHDVWHYAGEWWPLLLVLIGVTKLLNAWTANERLSGLFWIAIGGLLLAYNQGWIHFNVLNVFWPLVLILLGIRIVGRALGNPRFGRGAVELTNRTHAFALLSGVTRRLSTQDFRGGDATAIMGGCEIDLRQCDITQGTAVFDVFALMGGIELYVPGEWSLRNEGLAILGGIEDSRKETAGNPAKVLVLRGQAIMGGIEIKN
jgi:predicted membrane protein